MARIFRATADVRRFMPRVAIKGETIVLCIILTVIIAGGLWGANNHFNAQRRTLVSAVTNHLDRHSDQVVELLTTMRGSNVTVVEDAAFEELRKLSLITRSMIKVASGTNGNLECVIDTSSLGIEPRTIRSSR